MFGRQDICVLLCNDQLIWYCHLLRGLPLLLTKTHRQNNFWVLVDLLRVRFFSCDVNVIILFDESIFPFIVGSSRGCKIWCCSLFSGSIYNKAELGNCKIQCRWSGQLLEKIILVEFKLSYHLLYYGSILYSFIHVNGNLGFQLIIPCLHLIL